MSINSSVFLRVSHIFDNCKKLSLNRYHFQFPLVETVIQVSSRLFQMLDRADPAQSEISRRLWVMKSSILFTILPFDDPTLKLLDQMQELEQLLECLPDAAPLVASLRDAITGIAASGRNLKREWLVKKYPEALCEENGLIGILTGLSAGRSPGWPLEKDGCLAELNSQLLPIGSKKDLKSNFFRTIILPCACNNTSSLLLSELFYAGLTTKLEVLLYSGERFQPPKRLSLPSDGIFSERLQSSEMEEDVVALPIDQATLALDGWIDVAFWQALHSGARSSHDDLLPARYMLFFDGTGIFLPEDGSIMTLPIDGKLTDESDLCMVRIENICEGDIVVIRSGSSGGLVDKASERILGRDNNESLFDKATDWKDALDALLVTHSNEEVAAELCMRGSPVSAASIQRWIGPDVLGPRNESVFRELIYLLAAKGKIQKTSLELASYTEIRWSLLQDLRRLHQKAGSLIRQDLFRALFSKFGNKSKGGTLSDREVVRIEGDTDAQLLILRVAAVDSITAYVKPSRFGKIDNLVGNKWLG